MLSHWSRLWALLCLVLIIQQVNGEAFRIAPRADDEDQQKTRSIESASTFTRQHGSTTKTAEASEKKTESAEATDSKSETKSISVTASKTEKTQSSDPTSTSTDSSLESGLDDSSYFNCNAE
jgi:cytoskeletal protein RodZ